MGRGARASFKPVKHRSFTLSPPFCVTHCEHLAVALNLDVLFSNPYMQDACLAE
jgi:hypothetical protein